MSEVNSNQTNDDVKKTEIIGRRTFIKRLARATAVAAAVTSIPITLGGNNEASANNKPDNFDADNVAAPSENIVVGTRIMNLWPHLETLSIEYLLLPIVNLMAKFKIMILIKKCSMKLRMHLKMLENILKK